MLTPVLILVAALAAAAGVAAVAAPNPRHATLGAFAAVLLAAFVVDPMLDAPAIVARVAGAALGGWLLWTAARDAPLVTTRSSLGWPGTAAVAAAAFVLGWLAAAALGVTVATGVGGVPAADVPGGTLAAGSMVARAGIAAATCLAVLAAPAVVLPRDGLRLGLGVVLMIGAASLLSESLGASPDDVLELAFAILVALTGAAVAAVTEAMLRAGGDLILRDVLAREPAVRHRAADDAHRGAAR